MTSEKLIETAVQEMADTIGPVAIRQANKIPELQVSEKGEVENLEDTDVSVLKLLVEKYSKVNPSAKGIISREIDDVIEENDELEKPDFLEE